MSLIENLDIIPKEFPIIKVTLSIDAMYFNAVKKCLKEAKKSLKEVGKARAKFIKLRDKEVKILKKYCNDQYHAGDELELIYISMESAEYDIGAAYSPYFQNIALIHILCLTAAEAYINLIAKEHLEGKYIDIFEKLSIEGKWLLIPKVIGSTTFDHGSEPFQSFSKLIKYRNELVHYKGIKKDWVSLEYKYPDFVKKLGLSLRIARKSIKIIREMAIKLSTMINHDPPYWTREDYDDLMNQSEINFIDCVIEEKKKSKHKEN